MKNFIFLVFAFFAIQMISAQEQTIHRQDTIYDIKEVDLKPVHSRGFKAFYDFILKSFNPPEEEGIKGKIIITFIIETDGSMSDIKAIQDVGFGSGEKMIDFVKKSGKWIPAQKDGKPVRVLFKFSTIIGSAQ